MARGVNKVILIGNLGADPDKRTTSSGSSITTLSVATTEAWRDKTSGEQQERTEWHRVKLFGRLADIAADYLSKGRQVYIEGSLRTDKYTDKNGVERYSTDIIAREMQLIGGPGEGGSRGGAGSSGGYGNRERSSGGYGGASRGAAAPSAAPAGNAPPAGSDDAGFADDDIPF